VNGGTEVYCEVVCGTTGADGTLNAWLEIETPLVVGV